MCPSVLTRCSNLLEQLQAEQASSSNAQQQLALEMQEHANQLMKWNADKTSLQVDALQAMPDCACFGPEFILTKHGKTYRHSVLPFIIYLLRSTGAHKAALYTATCWFALPGFRLL